MSRAMTDAQRKKFQIKKTPYGFGLFAKKDFKRGEYLLDYSGKKITKEEGAKQKSGRYLMHYDRNFLIDGKGHENLGRYLNHACKPNCTMFMEGKRIKFYTKKNIQVGEELTFDYGKEYFDEYIKPVGCKCNSCSQK